MLVRKIFFIRSVLVSCPNLDGVEFGVRDTEGGN